MKQRSSEGLEAARTELEEREKVAEELHGVQVWLQAARGLLSEMEQSSGTEELQVSNFLPSYCKKNCVALKLMLNATNFTQKQHGRVALFIQPISNTRKLNVSQGFKVKILKKKIFKKSKNINAKKTQIRYDSEYGR